MAVKTKFSTQFSKADLERGREIQKHERVEDINPSSMFSTGVYCILSVAEKWSTAKGLHEELEKKGFDKPEYLGSHLKDLRRMMSHIRWPNKKFEYVSEFSLWWNGSSLPLKIMDDVRTGRNGEIRLREELATNAPGIAYKSASLFMLKLGYENVIPVDIWECRFLRDMGQNVRIGDYKKISGPKDEQYLKYESKLVKFAKGREMTPAVFHFTLWGKYHDSNLLRNGENGST